MKKMFSKIAVMGLILLFSFKGNSVFATEKDSIDVYKVIRRNICNY